METRHLRPLPQAQESGGEVKKHSTLPEIERLEVIIPEVARLREEALVGNDFDTAVLLSHVLAWLNHAAKLEAK